MEVHIMKQHQKDLTRDLLNAEIERDNPKPENRDHASFKEPDLITSLCFTDADGRNRRPHV